FAGQVLAAKNAQAIDPQAAKPDEKADRGLRDQQDDVEENGDRKQTGEQEDFLRRKKRPSAAERGVGDGSAQDKKQERGQAEGAERQDAQLDVIARPKPGQNTADADSRDEGKSSGLLAEACTPPPSSASWSMLTCASAPTA